MTVRKGYGICGVCILMLGLVPSAGALPTANELSNVRAGEAWSICCHYGADNTNNCNKCINQIECDTSVIWSKCVSFPSTTQCLACRREDMPCSGLRLDYAAGGTSCIGAYTTNGSCNARIYKEAHALSCGHPDVGNNTQTCPTGGTCPGDP